MASHAEDKKQRIQVQLDRIPSSSTFSGLERHRQFLNSLVAQALEGDADKLSESVIGFEAFRKGETFDPHIDSVVRIEVWRLREGPKEYYEEDQGNPMVITPRPRSFLPMSTEFAEVETPSCFRLGAWIISHKAVGLSLPTPGTQQFICRISLD